MNIEAEIMRFKMELLRKMPFYGDILMRLPFKENKSIQTARTDGGMIEYNPLFLQDLSSGQRNYVLMHEVMHVILFHCKRHKDRDPKIWNVASDLVVNNMLDILTANMNREGIPFSRPSFGVFGYVEQNETAENVYEKLVLKNRGKNMDSNKVVITAVTYGWSLKDTEVEAREDIVLRDPATVITGGSDEESMRLSEAAVAQLIRDAASANRSDHGSYFIPNQIIELTESKQIKWQTILREFFTEEQSDESSYATPEKKYLHMDLILPGYCKDDEKIEEIWAFVDSSGSIGKDDMDQFLTQLYRISKEFRCTLNICYWDTKVTDVYMNIQNEKDVWNCTPNHSGGTDINCVYKWIKEKKVRPDVMLILTDGYFGNLDNKVFKSELGNKTILVLSTDIQVNSDMKRIGKTTRLN